MLNMVISGIRLNHSDNISHPRRYHNHILENSEIKTQMSRSYSPAPSLDSYHRESKNKRVRLFDDRCDSGKQQCYHHNRGKQQCYRHDDHSRQGRDTHSRGPSEDGHNFHGKPHGYHYGWGGYPRRHDGSLSRHHHHVMKTECVAGSTGKSHDYHPASRQHNLADSVTKFARAPPHRVHEQNESQSSYESHLTSSPTKKITVLNGKQ